MNSVNSFIELRKDRAQSTLNEIINSMTIAKRKSFFETCIGINEIYSRRLYASTYNSIEEWAEHEFGMSRQMVYNYVYALEVMEKLVQVCDVNNCVRLPTAESHCRAIRQFDLPEPYFSRAWVNVCNMIESGVIKRVTAKIIDDVYYKMTLEIKKEQPELYDLTMEQITPSKFPDVYSANDSGFIYNPVGYCNFEWDLTELEIVPRPISDHFPDKSVVCVAKSQKELSAILDTASKVSDWIFLTYIAFNLPGAISTPGNVLLGVELQKSLDVNRDDMLAFDFGYINPMELFNIPQTLSWIVFAPKMDAGLFAYFFAQVATHPAIFISDDAIQPVQSYIQKQIQVEI